MNINGPIGVVSRLAVAGRHNQHLFSCYLLFAENTTMERYMPLRARENTLLANWISIEHHNDGYQ